MTTVKKFTFNVFAENTYILYDETRECIFIDPGCSDESERAELVNFIEQNGLKPVRLLNTHCHVDHIPGNGFLVERYFLGLEIHELELPVLKAAPQFGAYFGLVCEPSPEPSSFIEEGDVIKFGNTQLKTFFTPGHSPGSLSFYCAEGKFILVGDVLFYRSVGRFDLPGANKADLLDSILNKLMLLPDNVIVYSGHGQETTIGEERRLNPFFGKVNKI